MTSQRSDQQGDDGVHFFKVIFESNLRDGELRVPKSFVRRYWQEISATVVLSLPNGTEWKIYWLKHGGDVWFRNGWKEFAEYLCLKESQFLVFKYEGKSKFNVIVLGTSGLEIKYPSWTIIDDTDDDDDDDESDCSLEILDRKKKKMKINPKDEPESNNNGHAETTKHCGGKKKEYCAGGFDSSNKHKNTTGDTSEDSDDRIKKFHEEVRNSFHSTRDFFMCSLRRTYTERDLLVIPNEFAKPVLHGKEGDATLFVDPTRAWNIKLKQSCRQLTFTGGWKKFLADNNLKVGDVCVFELTDHKEVSFRVHIHRFGEESTTPRFQDYEGLSHHKPSSSLRNHETPKASSRFINSENNSFTIQMKHATSIHYVVIPIDFIRNYVVQNGTFATLRVGERTWLVKLLYYPHNGYSRLSQGWPQFVKDCNLKEGDSCHLEIINVANFEFRVSITRSNLN